MNCNTSEGYQALIDITTGVNNTAFGCGALFGDTTGSQNTATGSTALNSTNSDNNTADGFEALFKNAGGSENTAVGSQALASNTDGGGNTAVGRQALFNNTGGYNLGFFGDQNTAVGPLALSSLNGTVAGEARGNTGIGVAALNNLTTGTANIALGIGAGELPTTGDGNIDIGHPGFSDDAHTIRIGNKFIFGGPNSYQDRTFIAGIRTVTTGNDDAIPVVIDSAGQLGTSSSSSRFKTEIKPMDKASEALLQLRPVTFHYKNGSKGTPQFGLIAEEVAKVNPDLIVRDAKGEVYTVRYEAVNAMLLNEFLKEHRKVQELETGMTALIARVKDQESQIQKVSAQVELNKPAPRTAVNNQ